MTRNQKFQDSLASGQQTGVCLLQLHDRGVSRRLVEQHLEATEPRWEERCNVAPVPLDVRVDEPDKVLEVLSEGVIERCVGVGRCHAVIPVIFEVIGVLGGGDGKLGLRGCG